MIVSSATAEHYNWSDGCDGWILASGNDLLVIEDLMPPKTSETRHYHTKAKQFFYVLSGVLTVEVGCVSHEVSARKGMEAQNEGGCSLLTLVLVSAEEPVEHVVCL